MRLLLVDNHDSFTWNLYHLLAPAADVHVALNDAISVDEAAQFDGIVLSPGPGLPAEAGFMPALLQALMPSHPILGVCLGMQAIVEACGGVLYNQERVQHGVAVRCIPQRPIDALFTGLEGGMDVGLYHSWAADPESMPATLRITSRSDAGVVMSVRHERFPVCGVQFHPESILTPLGGALVRNWLDEVHRAGR